MVKRHDIKTTSQNNFIGCWNIDKDICNKIITYYENNPSQIKEGETGGKIKKEVKLSEDISVQPRMLQEESHKIFLDYMNILKQCYQDYIIQWPELQNLFSSIEVSSFNIQKYYPGGHLKKYHMERTNILTSSRIFAWMTYLNTVEEGGTTDFLYYDLSIKPEIGKTIIWPAEWTHAHRGDVVSKGLKYIITGWFHLSDDLIYDPSSPNYGLPKKNL